MNKLMVAGLVMLALGLSGCVKQEPNRYYDLTSQASASGQLIHKTVTLGIGPVTLPQVLDRPGIVTRFKGTGVNVASYHTWAGDLEPAFTHVLADSLAMTLQHDQVWPSPWDNRFRPEYQVRIFVDRFSGELNGTSNLNLTWTLLGDYGKTVIKTRRYRAVAESGQGYGDYVSALNQLLADFSRTMSAELASSLPGN
ncbi:MAG: PqiC family protein [Pontibacterium sp.]